MKKQFLFFIFLILVLFCNAQSKTALDYKTLLVKGDSAWKKNDTGVARNFYNEAASFKTYSAELDYRFHHLKKEYALFWNDSINRFFKYLELGDYCSKDKCYRAARSCYEKALAIASKKEYKCLKNTTHTRYAKKRIKIIKKWSR